MIKPTIAKKNNIVSVWVARSKTVSFLRPISKMLSSLSFSNNSTVMWHKVTFELLWNHETYSHITSTFASTFHRRNINQSFSRLLLLLLRNLTAEHRNRIFANVAFKKLKNKRCLHFTAGKGRLHQLSSGMRRTVSLEAIIGPYLQGQWPKEHESQSNPSHQDKSTQVSSTKTAAPQKY